MIGDLILVNEGHKDKAKKILPKIKRDNIVLISGISGTGKTEVALCLSNFLYEKGITSLVISIDDYYKTKWGDRERERKSGGVKSVGLHEIDWDILKHLVNSFNKKAMLRYQRIHKNANKLEFTTSSSKGVDVLIIEGLYSAYLKKFDKGDVIVYLEGSPKQTYDFRLKRFKENPDSKFRQEVVMRESRIVSQLRRYCNLVIPFDINE